MNQTLLNVATSEMSAIANAGHGLAESCHACSVLNCLYGVAVLACLRQQDSFPAVKGIWANSRANFRGKKISSEVLEYSYGNLLNLLCKLQSALCKYLYIASGVLSLCLYCSVLFAVFPEHLFFQRQNNCGIHRDLFVLGKYSILKVYHFIIAHSLFC